jgi:hypothetical protein
MRNFSDAKTLCSRQYRPEVGRRAKVLGCRRQRRQAELTQTLVRHQHGLSGVAPDVKTNSARPATSVGLLISSPGTPLGLRRRLDVISQFSLPRSYEIDAERLAESYWRLSKKR